MKLPALTVLLILMTGITSALAALSATPVVTVESVNLPKLTLSISNPDKEKPCTIWQDWNSWGGDNKWFSLRGKDGKIWNFRKVPQIYTVNYPKADTIAPGKSLTFKIDLADKSWEMPKEFVRGAWNYDVEAHLETDRSVEAHLFGVFIGYAASGWYDVKGREVEKAEKPGQDRFHAAVETGKDFPWERLTKQLEKWNAGTLPDNQSIGGFFGADFPWDEALCTYSTGQDLNVILPEQSILRIRFHTEQKAAWLVENGKVKERYLNRKWDPAAETLAKTPAGNISSVVLLRSLKGDPPFRRAFDAKGRVDEKETLNLQ